MITMYIPVTSCHHIGNRTPHEPLYVTKRCRQNLISFKVLTSRQKYKTVGSSTLLRKASFAVPVFFGVQRSSTLLRKASFAVPVFFGVQRSSTLLRKASFAVPVFFGVQSIHQFKSLETLGFSSSEMNSDCGFQLGNPTPQEMRTAIYGWHLRSKCVDPFVPQSLLRSCKKYKNYFIYSLSPLWGFSHEKEDLYAVYHVFGSRNHQLSLYPL